MSNGRKREHPFEWLPVQTFSAEDPFVSEFCTTQSINSIGARLLAGRSWTHASKRQEALKVILKEILRLRKLLGLAVILTVFCSKVGAQSTINSDGVSVRNSAPANVLFQFQLGESNVVLIQLGCSDSATNRNYVYIYEEQPGGSIVTYNLPVEIDCNEAYGQGFTTFTASLKSAITVTTPDHVITIESSTAWTAAKKSGLHGPYWAATGGSAQITVGTQSAAIPRCESKRVPCPGFGR